MPIRFPCTACGQLLGIATRKVGTEIHCPTCGLAVIVPDEEGAKLLRQQARTPNKNLFPSPDTPPEISIPREQHEAFDGGLESFLTQLEVVPTPRKPAPTATLASTKTVPPKSAPPIMPPALTTPVNGNNGTHALPPRPGRTTATTPTAKVTAAAAPAEEIPLAIPFDDQEVTLLSAGDLLELAEDPAPKPTPKPALPPIAKKPTAPIQSSPPAAKPATKMPPPVTQTATPAIVIAPAVVPLVEHVRPPATDYGFDFSQPAAVPATARKAEPTPSTTVPTSQPLVTIPAAPFADAVWLSRRAIYTHVAILVLVSLVTFLVGWISGGAGSRLPVGNNAGPVRFEAKLQYLAANGKTLPDDGAVVLIWPKQSKPLERLSSKRLAPAEPAPPRDSPTLQAIETLRGAYTRADAQGEVRDVLLPEPGEYYVLVISRNLARPANEVINDKAIPILGDLFGAEALTLLGTRQFTLKSYTIADTRTLAHTFGAPAEVK